MAASEVSKKEQNPKIPILPGVSYLPDKIEVAENPALIQKIEGEFFDFLVTLNDILKLLHLIKPKHLRSLNPIPHNVIREMRVFGNKGPLYKKFDKQTSGTIPGISASADNLFRRGMSQGSYLGGKARPLLKKEGVKKKTLESDLVEIIGKKTKPLWHTVALERPPELNLTQVLEKKAENTTDETAQTRLQRDIINKKNIPVTRTHSESIIIAIKYLMQTQVRTKDKNFQNQMDMMAASDAGFKSVDAYKTYLDTLKPHWFKDLLKDCIHIGLFTSREILEAFENLGHFYHMDDNSLVLAKPRLCYLLMSLPIWDVCRLPVQRVFDFILYQIIQEPKIKNIIEEWLTVRKLSYVVMAPIYADDLLGMTEAQQQQQQEQPQQQIIVIHTPSEHTNQ
ncbi:uncharacterized protein LOC131938612 [Physella acuta]|uniref:uncharacterized protein LOC131938612 n=1 Tax=Physella acuta TaxID=109671 RepID=UPI0027DB39AB|nr:uncharacterized protein LOC131938612 [Physella acuta]